MLGWRLPISNEVGHAVSRGRPLEFQRLYHEFTAANDKAFAILKAKGMQSAEFAEADRAASEIWVKLRRLQGKEGQHWMA
jgi:hypothetical protein